MKKIFLVIALATTLSGCATLTGLTDKVSCETAVTLRNKAQKVLDTVDKVCPFAKEKPEATKTE